MEEGFEKALGRFGAVLVKEDSELSELFMAVFFLLRRRTEGFAEDDKAGIVRFGEGIMGREFGKAEEEPGHHFSGLLRSKAFDLN